MRFPLLVSCCCALSFVSFSLPMASANAPDAARLQALDERTAALPRVHAVVVAHDGEIVHEIHQGGPGVAAPANVKSLSKTVLAAITRGRLSKRA